MLDNEVVELHQIGGCEGVLQEDLEVLNVQQPAAPLGQLRIVVVEQGRQKLDGLQCICGWHH